MLRRNLIIWFKYKQNIEKGNEFSFLNEKVEEFTSKWSQSLVNLKNSVYLKQKALKYFY